MKNFKLACAATALLAIATPYAAQAQSAYDDQQQLIAQVQADKRAVVLKAMALDDAQVAAFAPIYDAYQADRKKLMERSVNLLNSYASNYDSMTDDAAKGLLKEWLKIRDDEDALMDKYVKKFDKVLPTTKVLRFVQVENKLDTLLRLPSVQAIPLAK
jgi:Spy/CpxP family protein refolding chaperone